MWKFQIVSYNKMNLWSLTNYIYSHKEPLDYSTQT